MHNIVIYIAVPSKFRVAPAGTINLVIDLGILFSVSKHSNVVGITNLLADFLIASMNAFFVLIANSKQDFPVNKK
jgi:hypothetical protein